MMGKKRVQIILAISVLLVSSLVAFFWQTSVVNADSAKSAPDFTLTDIYGETLSLSGLEGKVVLIDFWATWCGFCRGSIPVLNSLYDSYQDKGLEIVGISSEPEEILRQFAKKKDIIYSLASDKEDLASKYGVYGVPTRFLINRQGQIAEKLIGFRKKEDLEAAIKNLL